MDNQYRSSQSYEAASNAFKGNTMKDFEQLRISLKVMKDGILFVWAEKEYIMRVCTFFESQGFSYIENVCFCLLDEKMRKGKSFYDF